MKIEVSIKSKQALYELWTNKENFPFSDSTYPSRNWIIWFQHPDNLTHLRPLLWIWIHTPQSGQQCTFESSRRRPCLYGGINYLLWPPASNHHFQPVNQIHLQMAKVSSSVRKITDTISCFHETNWTMEGNMAFVHYLIVSFYWCYEEHFSLDVVFNLWPLNIKVKSSLRMVTGTSIWKHTHLSCFYQENSWY